MIVYTNTTFTGALRDTVSWVKRGCEYRIFQYDYGDGKLTWVTEIWGGN